MLTELEYEAERRKLWLDTVVAISTDSECKSPDFAMTWADGLVKGYEDRFFSKVVVSAKIPVDKDNVLL